VLLVEGRGKSVILPAVTVVLQYCYITLLCIYGLTVVLLVQGIGDMLNLPAVTAVLLHHTSMDIWTVCSVVSAGMM
jgi:hypothetical protein